MSFENEPQSALSKHQAYFYDLYRKYHSNMNDDIARRELGNISDVVMDLAGDGVLLPDGSSFVMYASMSQAYLLDPDSTYATGKLTDNVNAVIQIRYKEDGFRVEESSTQAFTWGVEIQLQDRPYRAFAMAEDGLVYSYDEKIGVGEADEFEEPLINSFHVVVNSLSMFINPMVFITKV